MASLSGNIAIGPIGFNGQVGVAMNLKTGDAMGFFQFGKSQGFGMTGGGQVTAQTGSLDDLLKPTGQGGGENMSFSLEPVGGSVSAADGKPVQLTGGGVATKGPLGIFHNESWGGRGIGTTNVYQHLRDAWNSTKQSVTAPVKDFIAGAEQFNRAVSGY